MYELWWCDIKGNLDVYLMSAWKHLSVVERNSRCCFNFDNSFSLIYKSALSSAVTEFTAPVSLTTKIKGLVDHHGASTLFFTSLDAWVQLSFL